ncbi:MAG TPA: hypothetical protein VGR36_04945 [Candidatus Acidoferrales bacterium]|nr:hypothetical protein [Candidatus Acidoferrales bacterium]
MKSGCRLTFLLSASLLFSLGTGAQGSVGLPRVVQHAAPIYPEIARTAHIEGEVVVKFTTDGKSVQEAAAESGPLLLRRTAEDNVRTWKFDGDRSGTFSVTFLFKIMSDAVEVRFLQSPGIVEIEAPPPPIIIDYADIGLGKWNARLTSAHSSISAVFDLAYTGASGEWLIVDASTAQGESEGEFGYRDGDLLTFAIKLALPNGKRAETLLTGRMKGKKIIGSFVDQAGNSGTWTAIRK